MAENNTRNPTPLRWRAFLIVLRQAMLVVVTWIEKECGLKRRDK